MGSMIFSQTSWVFRTLILLSEMPMKSIKSIPHEFLTVEDSDDANVGLFVADTATPIKPRRS